MTYPDEDINTFTPLPAEPMDDEELWEIEAQLSLHPDAKPTPGLERLEAISWRERAGLMMRHINWQQDRIEEGDDAPWPAWAAKVLAVIRSHSGYDGYDDHHQGVDMPSELDECLNEVWGFAEQRQTEARVKYETDNHRQAAEHYRKQADDLRQEHDALVEVLEKLIDQVDRGFLVQDSWEAHDVVDAARTALKAAGGAE